MMPAPLLDAYLDALPALEAQEDLRAVTVAALAAGTMPRRQADAVLRDLRRKAGAGAPRAARPRDLADLRRGLRGAGVAVRVQERAEERSGEAGGPGTTPPTGKSLTRPENEAEGV